MNLEGKVMGYEKKTLAIVIIIIIAAGAVFYAGAKYEKHKLSALGLLSGSKSSSKKATAGNSIKGTVTATDDKSVTIKMADGTDKTIEFSSGMTFGNNAAGSASDLFVGELVVIAGENNPDGSFAATNIRISKKSPKASATPTINTPATTGTSVTPATPPTATSVPMAPAPAAK